MLHLMATLSLLAATPSAETPDLSWMAGNWLDCSGGREASEVWSGPRDGLMVGHTLTTRNGRSGFEFSHIRPQADGVLAYVAQPSGAPPTVFRLLRHDAKALFFPIPRTISLTGSFISVVETNFWPVSRAQMTTRTGVWNGPSTKPS